MPSEFTPSKLVDFWLRVAMQKAMREVKRQDHEDSIHRTQRKFEKKRIGYQERLARNKVGVPIQHLDSARP